MTEPNALPPLPEDLVAGVRDLLHDFGDRYQLVPGCDEDGWKLTITDRPSVPNGRVVIARCIREARVMLAALDEGLP
jgi:hypothetical protein